MSLKFTKIATTTVLCITAIYAVRCILPASASPISRFESTRVVGGEPSCTDWDYGHVACGGIVVCNGVQTVCPDLGCFIGDGTLAIDYKPCDVTDPLRNCKPMQTCYVCGTTVCGTKQVTIALKPCGTP
jgi:hypothetical protein